MNFVNEYTPLGKLVVPGKMMSKKGKATSILFAVCSSGI